MNKLLFLAALLGCVFALAAAADPEKPLWPNGWSASVIIRRSWEPFPQFFRWFWDYTAKKDRMDGLVLWKDEWTFASVIFDHAQTKEFAVFYQEDAVACYTRPINATMYKPNFGNLEFGGKGLVDYIPVYHWFYEDREKGHSFQVWDRQDNREIKRIDFDDKNRGASETWTFMEYDAGTQDPSLFVVPETIAAQCT